MKRGIKTKMVLLCVAILLCVPSHSWAQFGFEMFEEEGTGDGYRNSVANSTSVPAGGNEARIEATSQDLTSFAFNPTDNDTDPFSYHVLAVNHHDYQSALVAVGSDAANNFGTETTDGSYQKIQLKDGANVDIANAFLRVGFDSGTNSVVVEITDDNGVSWTALSGTSYTAQAFIAKFSSNSEAATQSRQDKAKVSSRMTSQMVTTRVMNAFSPKPKTNKVAQYNTTNAFASGYTDNSGISSGSDPYAGLGIWSMGAYATTEVTKSNAKSDGNIGIFMLGADKLLLDDKLVVGLGAGYENSWSKIKSTSRKDDGQGFAISPYAAYRVTDDFIIKGVLNAAFNNYDADSGGKDYKGTRTMGDLSGEYTWLVNHWLFATEAGYMYMSEDFDSGYTDVYLSEGRLSGKTGYEFDNGLLPYIRGTYFHDFSSSASPGWEKGSFEAAAGVEWGKGSWTVSAEFFDNFNGDRETIGGSALVRYEF